MSSETVCTTATHYAFHRTVMANDLHKTINVHAVVASSSKFFSAVPLCPVVPLCPTLPYFLRTSGYLKNYSIFLNNFFFRRTCEQTPTWANFKNVDFMVKDHSFFNFKTLLRVWLSRTTPRYWSLKVHNLANIRPIYIILEDFFQKTSHLST